MRRLCPRPIIVLSITRTDPIGMPPYCNPFFASSMAASKNGSMCIFNFIESSLIF